MVIIVVVNERKTIIKPQLGTARKCHAFYNKLISNIGTVRKSRTFYNKLGTVGKC